MCLKLYGPGTPVHTVRYRVYGTGYLVHIPPGTVATRTAPRPHPVCITYSVQYKGELFTTVLPVYVLFTVYQVPGIAQVLVVAEPFFFSFSLNGLKQKAVGGGHQRFGLNDLLKELAEVCLCPAACQIFAGRKSHEFFTRRPFLIKNMARLL